MTNPTNPFSWQMPTATDLVTDLPADFEVFGQAVATSMADLLGGTTGQVLSKASNTNMDFTWVTTDDANAIQNSIVDAKGDIVAATANDTPARLAVGNNGEALLADSSATTGLRYVATPSASNPVLNSAFNVWQRGTSISLGASASYTVGFLADRWQTSTSAAQASTITRQATGDTTNLPDIQYALRYQRNAGQTGTAVSGFYQSIETVNSIPFVGKTITYSFYARAGANFSPTSSGITMALYTGTGTDESVFAYSGRVTLISAAKTLTTTWQRFTATATVGTTSKEIALGVEWTPTGTAGANDFFEVTGVQIDIGSVALPFRTTGTTYQQELAACQRYYYRFTGDGAYQNYGVGMAQIATSARIWVVNPVTMRVKPTSLDYGNLTLSQIDAAYPVTALAIQTDTSGKNGVSLAATVASGLTTYRTYFLYNDNNTAGYVGLSAEL
jgi:hypothetical protein